MMMALIECKGSELELGVQGRWAEIFRTKRGSEAQDLSLYQPIRQSRCHGYSSCAEQQQQRQPQQ